MSSLEIVYSRRLTPHRLKHYTFHFSDILFSGKSPDIFAIERIAKLEGIGLDEVEIKGGSLQGPPAEEVLKSKEAPSVLEGLSKVRKQLLKSKGYGLVHQYLVPKSNPLFCFLGRFIGSLNQLIGKVNLFLARIRCLTIPTLPEPEYDHRMTQATCLSIIFEAEDLEKAVSIFRNDLSTLADRKLIVGHLAMPSMMLLADTVGSGQSTYVMFCYLFLDQDRLAEVPGYIPNSYKLQLGELLGIKCEGTEGGIGCRDLEPSLKYNIERVCVGSRIQERNDAHHDSYMESLEQVNKVGKVFADALADPENETIAKLKEDLRVKNPKPTA